MIGIWDPSKIIEHFSIFIENCNSSAQFKEFVKFRKTKYEPLISVKIHILIQNVNVSFWTISSCWEFLKKRFLVEIKAKYFFIGAKMRGVETEWREAWWRQGGWGTSFAGLEVILEIQRLGGHFCGDHGASATPPSSRHTHPNNWERKCRLNSKWPYNSYKGMSDSQLYHLSQMGCERKMKGV